MSILDPKGTRYALLSLPLVFISYAGNCYAEGDSANGITDFLSDPHRVGSLTGTIIGGALTAHPAGAAAGTILGYIIGKKTMHKSTEELNAQNYAQRSIIPMQGERTQVLALSSDASDGDIYPLADEMSLAQQAEDTGAEIDAISDIEVEFEAPTKDVTPAEKIASYCYGSGGLKSKFDPKLQAMCYYHQSAG